MSFEVFSSPSLTLAAIFLGQAALILAVLHQRRLRRLAEAQVRARDADLRASRERIRQIGGRLLIAQDAERSRIARELHDDVSQQVARLRMDLAHVGTDAHTLVLVDGIARSLRHLVHRLHPASLQLLGVVPCLRALQREQSRDDMSVVFTHGDVPEGLPPELTLCLTRVAQEAVQNAVKYSQASEVSIDLRRDNAGLAMTIADDGVGFELRTAWGKGLGLISIRERVETCGGTAVIHSRPGGGTRFDVRLPVAMESAQVFPAEPLVRAPRSERAPRGTSIAETGVRRISIA